MKTSFTSVFAMVNSVFVFIAIVAVSLQLTACGSGNEFADIKAQMEEIKRRPQGRIEAPPEFKTYQNFLYSASLMRSPFQPPVVVEPMKALVKGRKVTPDFDRAKELLEDFSIDALTMVGTLSRTGNELFSLVRDNKAGIHRVTVGNYLGRNHGRVVDITTEKIDVIELIPDGEDGWVERPRAIVLKNQ